MKVVIDIPKTFYSDITKSSNIHLGEFYANKIVKIIKNGMPLPKGHGRLIDENDLKTLFGMDDRLWWSNAVEEFTRLPTIIEADTKSVKVGDKK